ncbi:hypothetical protein TRVA0_003S02036 [Trichomonascus vanleenenianus]|uniref:uncharacterized protein n=1 Tax=Trichomonascus vanleenenianus TaxID=2268995 RepID=UPI003ECA6829
MLSTLPVEILEKIITYARKDVSTLRLTCRKINSASLPVTWRQVNITSSGDFKNAFFKYWMDSEKLVEIISLYKDYIRLVKLTMSGYEQVERCEKVPEILDLIWKKARGVRSVDICLEESLLRKDPVVRDWLHTITEPFQESEPPLVAVEYYSEPEYDNSNFFNDTRTTVLMIMRMKNLKSFEFSMKLDRMALDVGFFRDVGKYINDFNFNADPLTILTFNDAIKHCTSLRSFYLHFAAVEGREDGNYEYRLPDSVQSVTLNSDGRFIHTIRGAQVTSLVLAGDERIKVCGTMPNLSVIKIDGIVQGDPEGVACFKSLVKASRHLKTVYIGDMFAPATTQIAEILDRRVHISRLLLMDISFAEAMAVVPAMTMRGSVAAYLTHDDAENTELMWHYTGLLLKKAPGLAHLSLHIRPFFSAESSFSPLPGYTKEVMPGWYNVDLDRVKQRLLESPE